MAIRLNNVVKEHIDNVLTRNTIRGIFITNSEGILIENSVHKDHGYLVVNGAIVSNGVSIRIEDSINIIIKDDSVSATPTVIDPNIQPVALGYDIRRTKDVIIENVNITNVDLGISFGETDNVNIDKLNITLSPLASFYNFMQFGQSGFPSNNTIIRNSTFISRTLGPGLDGLLLVEGNNALIQNVTIRANTSLNLPTGTPTAGAIHIGAFGGFGGFFVNVKIMDTIVSGSNMDAILIENARNVTLDNVVVNAALENNIRLITAQNVTVKNSDVQDGTTNGINIEATSSCNTISNTNIRDNGLGLLIAAGSINNIIRNNNFYCNVTNTFPFPANPLNTFVHNIPVVINNTGL